MTENERWNEVCRPTLDRIDRNVGKLMEVVVTGNGKPALTSRVEALERSAGDDSRMRRSRSLKVGPIEINGYAASDVAKVVLAIGLAAAIWLLLVDRRERVDLLKSIRGKAAAGQTTAQDAPGLDATRRPL